VTKSIKQKLKKKSKNACKADEEDSEDTSCLYCFGTSTEMCVRCTDCKLRSDVECTDGSPKCVCLELSYLMKLEYFIENENVYCWWQASVLLSYRYF